MEFEIVESEIILESNPTRGITLIKNTGVNSAKLIFEDLIGVSGLPIEINLYHPGAETTLDGSYKGIISASSAEGTTLLVTEL